MTPKTSQTQPTACHTCLGHGLWAMGAATPMGHMDAQDGMPTIPCPECGANDNPEKKHLPLAPRRHHTRLAKRAEAEAGDE